MTPSNSVSKTVYPDEWTTSFIDKPYLQTPWDMSSIHPGITQEEIIISKWKDIPLEIGPVSKTDTTDTNFYTKHGRIWYRYYPGGDIWVLSDRKDRTGIVRIFSASLYRIDQCLQTMKEQMKDLKKLF